MKKAAFQDRLPAIPKRTAEEKKGASGIDELAGEARRRAGIEHEENLHRSRLVKILLMLALASVFAAAASGVYGVYHFPDAPLRQQGEVYSGKHGQPRTRVDYEHYLAWEKALFGAFGSTFFFALAFGIMDSREKRHRQLL